MKRTNPYTSLKNDILDFCRKIKYAHAVTMWHYPKDKLATQNVWRLDDLYERVKAAEQLGYEVKLYADEKGLHVKYVKKVEIPYSWS